MKKITLFLAIFAIGLHSLWAQTREITGTVTSADDGSTIPGVSVSVKGTTVGTITNMDGQYTIAAPENAQILTFSFVGMQSLEVKITGNVINAKLSPDVIGLNEVVVTALGIKREKKKLGYSVTSVKDEELTKGTNNSFTNALSGKIAGVQVTGGVGAPGSSTNVVLRGYSNIGRSTQPLYIIDGVAVTNAAQNFSDGNTTGDNVNRTVDFGNGINDISLLDIESMEILRGAAATSLYGSQAANGVIMITTKSGRGKAGKTTPNITISSSTIFSTVLKYPDYQDTFGQGWDGKFASEENGSWGPRFTDESKLWGNEVNGTQLYKNFSFLEDQVKDFYDVGKTYDNSIAISGGSDIANYYVSYNYVSSDGVVPKDKDSFKKHSFRIKTGLNLGFLTADASINYINKVTDALSTGQSLGGTSNLFDDILQTPTDISLVDQENYKDPSSFYHPNNYYTPYLLNPYFTIDNSTNQATVDRFIGNSNMVFTILPEYRLTGTLRFGGDVSNTFGYNFDKKFTLDDASVNKGQKSDLPGYYREFQRNVTQYSLDMILGAGYDFNEDLVIDANAGLTISSRTRNYSEESVDGLVFEQAFPNLANSSSTPKVTDGFKEQRRLVGLFGSVELGYKEYLFLTLSARNDWSSTLPKENNTYFYPSAGLGFVASDALNFLKESDALDYLKLRLSYGLSGNDAPPYVVSPVYVQGQVTGGIPFSDLTFPLASATGYEYSNTLGNPNLKPEISYDFETGVDVRFFNNRIGLDATYYYRRTDGLILQRTVASSSGFTSQYDNIGEIINKGVELTLNLTPVRTTDFSWNINYSYAKNKNEVTELVEGLDEVVITGFTSPNIAAIAGKTVSQIKAFGKKYTPDGRIIVDPQTGRPLNTDQNIDLGSTLHDYTMGMINEFTYKNLSLSFQLDYRKGGKFISWSKHSMMWAGKDPLTTYNDRLPFVVPNSVVEVTNEDGTVSYEENTNPITTIDLNNYYSGDWNDESLVIDKTFLKLREVNLTYRIPKQLLSSTFVETASISFIGNNLLLFTPKENNVVDPETFTTNNGPNSEFGEVNGYPSLRSYGFKLNVSF